MESGIPECAKELYLSARFNDLDRFRRAVETHDCDVNMLIPWRGRRFGSHVLSEISRTPLMIAVMYGSLDVINYMINDCGGRTVDVNKNSDTDNLTVINCVDEYNDKNRSQVVDLLKRRFDRFKVTPAGYVFLPDPPQLGWSDQTNEFMMFQYKMTPCSSSSRAGVCYGNNLKCPFVHDSEIYRRDFVNTYYSSTPCPDDSCNLLTCPRAHGELETLFHPEVFRTEFCRDGMLCEKEVCSFAHCSMELRQPTEAPTPFSTNKKERAAF